MEEQEQPGLWQATLGLENDAATVKLKAEALAFAITLAGADFYSLALSGSERSFNTSEKQLSESELMALYSAICISVFDKCLPVEQAEELSSALLRAVESSLSARDTSERLREHFARRSIELLAQTNVYSDTSQIRLPMCFFESYEEQTRLLRLPHDVVQFVLMNRIVNGKLKSWQLRVLARGHNVTGNAIVAT